MDLGKQGVRKELKKVTTKRQKRKSRVLTIVITAVFVAIFLLGTAGGAIGYGMVRGIIADTPKITSQDIIPSEQMSVLYDAKGNTIDTLIQAGSNRTNVKDYNSIPKNLINAFVAVEDARFWEHNGIDLKGILRAGFLGVARGFHFSEGASTITQQLIKNSVFTDWLNEETLGDRIERKVQEQYLALQLEESVSKKEILLSYLNAINLGNNCLGIAQASRRYFGKEYTELTLSESCVIAAITNNPTAYNPIRFPDNNKKRVAKILDDMEEQGYITKAEKEAAVKDDVYSRISNYNDTYTSTVDTPTTYYVDSVIAQVTEDLKKERGYTQAQATKLLYSGGLQIYTNYDPAVQKIIDEEINNPKHYTKELTKYSCTFTMLIKFANGTTDTFTDNGLRIYFRQKSSSFKFIADSKEDLMKYIEEFAESVCDTKKGDTWEITAINYTLQPQISFVVMDQHDGRVLGISGGRGEKTQSLSLNRAISSPRQPGSLFKVLAGFVPAVDACNANLSDVYYDAPYSVGQKTFNNYWGKAYMGYSSIRQSIVYSMNVVAVKCLVDTVTPSLAFDYLEDMGFTTLARSVTSNDGTIRTDIGPALVLGGLTYGVTNLETTAAYASIANGGTYTEPCFYSQIKDSDGNVIIDKTPSTNTVMKETTAYLISKAMEETMDGIKYPNDSSTTNLYGTGKAADVAGQAIAGKTGTTTGTYDIWFAGFSPYYTAVIWSGFDEQQEIKKSTSANYHKEIWQAIMTRLHDGLAHKEFQAPAAIVTKSVCKKSGKLAVKGVCDHDPRGNMIYTEYFESGNEPTEICDKHGAITICTESKMKAGPDCPETKTSVYMLIDSADASAGSTDDSKFAIRSLKTCDLDHKAIQASIEASIAESIALEESKKASEAASQAESLQGEVGTVKPSRTRTSHSDEESSKHKTSTSKKSKHETSSSSD